MGKTIYGVNTDEQVTPIKVRDAIIRCFEEAHAEVLNAMRTYVHPKSEEEYEELKKLQVEALIRKYFGEIQADFENPKQEDLVKICDKLAEFAAHFRSQDIIKKHYDEIMKLINLIPKGKD